MRYNNREYLLNALEELGYRFIPPESDVAVRNRSAELDQFIDQCLYDLHEVQNLTMRNIERMLPVSFHTVSTHIHAMGLKTRPKGGPNNWKHGRYAGKRR